MIVPEVILNNILDEVLSLKEIVSKNTSKEWVSITQAEKILGIPRDSINAAIQNGRIPFRKSGSRYTVNIKLVRAHFCNDDIENMKQVRKEIEMKPLSRRKVTKSISNEAAPKKTANVRRQIV